MQLTKTNNIMKKVIMIIAAAFMVLACGGNKSQDPYTKYFDQAYEALEKGDYELADELINEYGEWLMTLDEAETQVAMEKLEEWYDVHGEKLEAMYEKQLEEAYGDFLDEYDEDELLEAYEDAMEKYGDDLEDAMEKYEDALEDALEGLDW